MYEAGQIVYRLVQAGLLDVEEDLTVEPAPAPVPEELEEKLASVTAAVTAAQKPAPDMGDIAAAVASALGSKVVEEEVVLEADPEPEPIVEAEEEVEEAPVGSIASRLISAFGGAAPADTQPEPEPELVDDEPVVPVVRSKKAGSAADSDLGELAKLITSVAYGRPEIEPEEIDTSALIPEDLLQGGMPITDQEKPEVPEADLADDPFGQSIARVSSALSDLARPAAGRLRPVRAVGPQAAQEGQGRSPPPGDRGRAPRADQGCRLG